MSDDFERIGPEVQRQLDRLGEVASNVSERALLKELASIPFDPALSAPGRHPGRVVAFGRERDVYDYNNFPNILKAIDDQIAGREPYGTDVAYLTNLDETKLQAIAAILRHERPNSYRRTIEVEEKKRSGQEPTDDERYILSQTYGAAARLAREFSASYPLEYLTG